MSMTSEDAIFKKEAKMDKVHQEVGNCNKLLGSQKLLSSHTSYPTLETISNEDSISFSAKETSPSKNNSNANG